MFVQRFLGPVDEPGVERLQFRGHVLQLTLGGTSTVQAIGNLLYLKPVPDGSRLKVGFITLTMPVLAKTISR